MTRGLVGVALVSLCFGLWAGPAGAITWGEEDIAGDYPNVGTIVLYLPDQLAAFEYCSGTLIQERVFLTAGHCTVGLPYYMQTLGAEVYVSFDFNPMAAPETWLEVESVITHPEFSFTPRSNMHDNGALILTEPVTDIEPAALPEEGFLDGLRREGELGHGTNGVKFAVVGYGATLTFPPPLTHENFVRQYAFSEFRALLPAWLRLSQQSRTGDGGTCYGDSGGPAFWQGPQGERVLVATTTWGDMPCVTSEFSQRIDLASALDFIHGVIDSLD